MTARYRHTQRVNPFLAVVPIGALLFMVLLAIVLGESHWLLWTSLLLLGLAFWMFSSLTVEITSRGLSWGYGPGLLKWHCPLEDITAVSNQRDPAHWVWRWGIRIEPYGYLYSISGGDTVRIRLKNGKQFGIRTDQSEEFITALSMAIGKTSEQGEAGS